MAVVRIVEDTVDQMFTATCATCGNSVTLARYRYDMKDGHSWFRHTYTGKNFCHLCWRDIMCRPVT